MNTQQKCVLDEQIDYASLATRLKIDRIQIPQQAKLQRLRTKIIGKDPNF
jgi:hypothetical protein